jgi:DNA-binding CsgD family transcriptional regulator
MLVGREAECRVIGRVLEQAKRGASGTLVVRGEPGAGKTALLRYAVERGRDMTLLTARGVEADSELAFAGLSDLFQPVLDRLDELPPPQAEALAGALALGPRPPGDGFTIAAATLSMLAGAAETRPVLAAVDDVQWLDAPSRSALLFAARRLDADAVALLFAVRDEEADPFQRAALPELVVDSLDREAAALLLARSLSTPLSAEVVGRLFRATRGNPLALLEIAALLSEGQLAGTEALGEELPHAALVERAFLRRVANLPAEAQRALVLAAASESGELRELAPAARALGVDLEILEHAEVPEIVRTEDLRLEFRNPLLRSAVYHAAPAEGRRAAHRALADAIGASGPRAKERRAWHLAAAASAPDEAVARMLEESAKAARERGGHAAAASGFERAARMTPDDERAAERLLEAATDRFLAGEAERALAILDQGLDSSLDPERRLRIQHLRGRVEMARGRGRFASELLLAEASRAEESDLGRASLMLTDACAAAIMSGDVKLGVEIAARARSAAKGQGRPIEITANLMLGWALILHGEARRGMPLLPRYESVLAEVEPLAPTVQFFANVLIWLEKYGSATDLLERVHEAALAASSPSLLVPVTLTRAELEFRTGKWALAHASAWKSVRFARDTGGAMHFNLPYLARIEAARGLESDCRAHAGEALEMAERYEIGSTFCQAHAALGLLELGLAHHDEATEHLEKVERFTEDHEQREPIVMQQTPDFIEACAHAGRTTEARDALIRLERHASATGRKWTLATAARCRGLFTDDFEAEFDDALGWHDRTPTPFERARTELCYGERLRRSRHTTEARERLHSALATFERLGAVPWAQRAEVELGATGERRRRGLAAHWELTPQEIEVATIVARGATNREAGAALFLSPKTIEAHLGRIYRKMRIRSRTELAHLLGERGQAEPGGGPRAQNGSPDT